jgi:hypothetical protein
MPRRKVLRAGRLLCDGVLALTAGLVAPSVNASMHHTWPESLPTNGPIALLRAARSLFVHSWFDYESILVASLVALQAVEAACHALYADAKAGTPFRALVGRAEREGILPSRGAEIAGLGVQLRSLLSHVTTTAIFALPSGKAVLDSSHRLEAIVGVAAAERAST